MRERFNTVYISETFEDVDSATTAVFSEARDVANANFLSLVRVWGSAFSDALGAVAAGRENVTAAKLARKVASLDIGFVALNWDFSESNRCKSSSEDEGLVHGNKSWIDAEGSRAHKKSQIYIFMNIV